MESYCKIVKKMPVGFDMKTLPILALLLLGGCASKPIRYDYSWGAIVRGSQSMVDKACDGVKHTDKGEALPYSFKLRGCWKPTEREVWIRWDQGGWEALPHELAHVDGVKDPKKEGYDR